MAFVIDYNDAVLSSLSSAREGLVDFLALDGVGARLRADDASRVVLFTRS